MQFRMVFSFKQYFTIFGPLGNLNPLKEKNDQICLEYAINSKPINKYMPKDKSCFQYKIWKIITSTYFDNFILGNVLNFSVGIAWNENIDVGTWMLVKSGCWWQFLGVGDGISILGTSFWWRRKRQKPSPTSQSGR